MHYKRDYEKIRKEAKEKNFTEILDYLNSIKLLIELCDEIEDPKNSRELMITKGLD